MNPIDDLKHELRRVEEQERILSRRRYELQLAIEEGEGRPDSLEARFARAVVTDDHAAITEICAEEAANFFRTWGHWPQEDIRERAMAKVGNDRKEQTHDPA